jgi:hypothetical protein
MTREPAAVEGARREGEPCDGVGLSPDLRELGPRAGGHLVRAVTTEIDIDDTGEVITS